MANRYWNPSADANWADANVWATTFNGDPTGVATPTSADDCFFTATNSHKCTIGAIANCNNLYFDNADNGGNGDYVGNFSGGSQLNVYGNLAISGGAMTLSYNGLLNFSGASGTKTIKSNSFIYQGNITFAGAGTYQLLDNFNFIGNIAFNAGTFDATTNTTTVTMSRTGGQQITGAVTFYNLTRTPTTPGKTDALTLTAGITVTNNLTISDGATLTNRVLVSSSAVGTPRTITCTGASVNYSNVDFQDITIVNGTLGTNTSVGDCGGNTGITFTGSVDQHWTNASSGSWSVSTNWTSRVPLPQDNVFMDKAFGTSQTVTADMPRLGASIDWTGATWTTGLTWTDSLAISLFGSLTLISGLTKTGTGGITFSGRGSYTIKTFGITTTETCNINAPTGTYQLLDDLYTSIVYIWNVINGTFDANGHDYHGGEVQSASGTTKSILMGTGTWYLTVASGNVWSVNAVTNITPSSSTIKITDTSNGNITFAGASKTYNNIYFSRGASTGSITITGSNTFNDFKDDGTAAHSILFTNGTTQTITTMEVSGTAGNLHTLSNSSGTTVANLTTASAQISNDYLNIAYLNVTPANVWYAGANSHNTGGADTNWIFTAPPLPPFTGKQVAGIDENGRQTIICAYDGDGQTIIPLQANPVNHALEIEDDTTGTDNGNNGGNAMLDQNSRQVWTALSSAGDGTIVEVYANSLNQLLVNSN